MPDLEREIERMRIQAALVEMLGPLPGDGVHPVVEEEVDEESVDEDDVWEYRAGHMNGDQDESSEDEEDEPQHVTRRVRMIHLPPEEG